MTAFEEMGILPELGKAVEELDWTLPTDVQAEAIPLILGGGDVLMAAETGSGKTGAFCLPIIQIVHETVKDMKDGKKFAKVSQTAAAVPSANWKLNPFDRGDAIAIDADGLLCQSRDQQKWYGTRSNKAVYGRGKYYYEATVTDEGLCRVGWSTDRASLDLGTDAQGFGFGGTGKKSFNKQFDDYGEAYGLNDTIGCTLDLDSDLVRWSKNGVDLGVAFQIPKSLKGSSFHAAVVLKNAEIQFNFGDLPLRYLPQGEGYLPLSKAPANSVAAYKAAVSGSVAPSSKKENQAPYAIIMEPSRELAEQTLAQIHKFKKHLDIPIRDLVCLGGVNAKEQIGALNQGVDIVVGTPGRLEDLISTGNLLLSQVRFFVLDEADGLLSGGYGDLINRMHGLIPKVSAEGKHLQMVVCSATLHSPDVKRMADRLMRFPTWIDLKGEDSVPETVHHVVCMVDPRKDMSWTSLRRHVATDGVHERDRMDPSSLPKETLSEAIKLLKGEYLCRALDEHKMDRAIIFCRTKVDCDNVEAYLTSRGGGPSASKSHPYSCVCLHSDRSPEERKGNLERFKRTEVRLLVCTDVAARGIDVSGLPYVINMTLPDEKQNYVHRIGRVGRAERMGLAISLVSTVPEKVWYHSNCNSKGKGCNNTRLTDQGGCCIWYNEPQLLGDIEDHLLVTIDQVDERFQIPVNEYDGKVVYGQKRKADRTAFKGHIDALAPAVVELAELERRAQTTFIDFKFRKTAK